MEEGPAKDLDVVGDGAAAELEADQHDAADVDQQQPVASEARRDAEDSAQSASLEVRAAPRPATGPRMVINDLRSASAWVRACPVMLRDHARQGEPPARARPLRGSIVGPVPTVAHGSPARSPLYPHQPPVEHLPRPPLPLP